MSEAKAKLVVSIMDTGEVGIDVTCDEHKISLAADPVFAIRIAEKILEAARILLDNPTADEARAPVPGSAAP